MFTSIFAVVLSAVAIPLLSRSLESQIPLQSSFSPDPTVVLDYGTFEGTTNDGVASFLGIPFAQPPVGRLRFAPPQPPLPFAGVKSAHDYGPGCYQQQATLNPDVGLPPYHYGANQTSEDCLSVNVIMPSGVRPDAAYPVLFSIHGGGFVLGTSSKMEIGPKIVQRSIELGQPIIYVSSNYRINAFGFLASEEIKADGGLNAGLLDQQMALQWTQKYISLFGGDPSKVTAIGSSAGGISIGLNMVANGGDRQELFRGAILQSGSVAHLGSYKDGQSYYDQLVSLTGCSGQDTLACLRRVPAKRLEEAVNNMPDILGYDSFKLAFQPRVDGDIFVEEPILAVAEGKVAQIPYINAANDDEGTIFALSSFNVTTDAQFKGYISYLTGMSEEQAESVSELYPDEPSAGSPFDTGNRWQIAPQYKRIAAFTGDWVFQAPRRHFLQSSGSNLKSWSYNFKMGKDFSFLGAAHGADRTAFGKKPACWDFVINFVYNLNPNIPVSPDSKLPVHWPTYASLPEGSLLEFSDAHGFNVVQDTFRKEAMQTLTEIMINLTNTREARRQFVREDLGKVLELPASI